MGMCKKCSKITGIIFLLGGIAFLLKDLGVWNFANISWYTFLFLIVGLTAFAKSTCKDCDKQSKK